MAGYETVQHGNYEITHEGDYYSCTCPAWRYQKKARPARTCKHTQQHVGDLPPPPPAPPAESMAAARGLLLAKKWAKQDVAGWWASEKYDGVRAYWDGQGHLLTRTGQPVRAPAWFMANLPRRWDLDGELWVGRGQFDQASSVARSGPAHPGWKTTKFVAFDCPGHPGTFEERQQHLATVVPPNSAVLAIAPQTQVVDANDVRTRLDQLVAGGGEGLMLRQPGSAYQTGRSGTLLKVKKMSSDEARVVAHVPGKGGHCGALLAELRSGKQFKIGTGLSDAQRMVPPAVGAVVTFNYQELTRAGVPRFPVFVGERWDAEWK
jgi:DNA ligase-1